MRNVLNQISKQPTFTMLHRSIEYSWSQGRAGSIALCKAPAQQRGWFLPILVISVITLLTCSDITEQWSDKPMGEGSQASLHKMVLLPFIAHEIETEWQIERRGGKRDRERRTGRMGRKTNTFRWIGKQNPSHNPSHMGHLSPALGRSGRLDDVWKQLQWKGERIEIKLG